MHTVWHIIEHALLDTLSVMYWLVPTYILIQLLESKLSGRIHRTKLLNGKYAPLLATAVGVVPQCGFSVVATDLYNSKQISMGVLLAVYIATSDEAIPLLLANSSHIVYILPMIAIKIVVALAVGYIIFAVENHSKSPVIVEHSHVASSSDTSDSHTQADDEHCSAQHQHEDNAQHAHYGCCGHDINAKYSNVTRYLVHPLVHSLKILAFVLVINILLGTVVELVGEDALLTFMANTIYVQPLLVALVGLLPNCASSVLITQLFVDGALTFSGAIAGLITNAGVGLAVLLRRNANKLNSLKVVGILYGVGVVVGYIITLVMMLL